ncbi:class I SAM-dependent methyltransferase [Pedobacter sp. HDW13]|uniref:class I SAM-dependent methyltransferase n=1 Tax=unclassified Pedobacter TaxID=2628915 RepID=UPI000F598EB6|nr:MULTISPECIES: class I SAM-dependent methyltransferase [unclassified Pedobacter]QIL38848.1 class I SAM-dependent methyltransferase [Pedobacter sp. HDW13]RQO67248.1 class I SAM-dependent methyltransferase [Pedobacter sp. KBW01]
MENGERKNVYQVYNKIGDWFAENRYADSVERVYLAPIIEQLPPNASMLDVGCGTGKPILEYFINHNVNVLGIDGSEKMIELARANFPGTRLILHDMRGLHLDEKFDVVIAWHSFFHLPAADQPAMFKVFKDHLNPDGILLFTSGTESGEAWGMNGGENLFHASLDTAEYHSLLRANQFVVLLHQVNDPDCGGANVWMAQYKPQ